MSIASRIFLTAALAAGLLIPAGAQAFQRDIPNATVQFLDTGHFALETHVDEVALAMRQFLAGK